jgi:hypothetical protein
MNLQKQGIWHRHDINPQPQGRDWDEDFNEKGGMDYLTVGDGTNMTHVNDFNAEAGGPWNIVFMKNSSALKFGYHSTWDNSERQLFKLAEIEVPGTCFSDGKARKGWYVGLSLLAEKYDNGQKILGYQRQNYGDDWILKVVPGETIPDETYDIRIMGEDLSASEDGDFDFNDIVLDVALTDKGADCKLQAAGATLKIRINGNDNLEVHKMFGVDQKVMVNTNADKAGLANAKKDPVEFSLTGNFKSADDILIQVYRQNKWMTLKAPKGDAASKIVVPITFVWPDERQSLKAKYPNFLNYVKDPETYREWWNNVVK